MIEYSINVEENEKLKAKVADNEEYMLEVMKEKIQAEEKYLNEKKITTG